jgi:hypothetical protein
MRTITKLLLGMAVPAALMAQSASAALITQWSYENIAAFTAFTSTNPGGTAPVTGSNPNAEVYTIGGAPANPLAGVPTKLSWGVPQNGQKSSLTVTSKVGPGIVNTNGADVLDLTVTHNNFVINLGQSLKTATLTGALLLQAAVPVTSPTLGPLPGNFKITFTETNNAGPCPAGVIPCPDIFVLDRAHSDPFSFNLGPPIDGYQYSLNVVVALQTLSNTACAAAGAAVGCEGFVTPENQPTSLPVFFNIKATPTTQVPEPGMLALLGRLSWSWLRSNPPP